jgi:hypothetical protein
MLLKLGKGKLRPVFYGHFASMGTRKHCNAFTMPSAGHVQVELALLFTSMAFISVLKDVNKKLGKW